MTFFEIVGYAVVVILALKATYNVSCFIYTSFLGRLLGCAINVKNYGPWAVVTGATDGIGKSYAKILASRGLNVILISRTPAKLEKVAGEIKSECPSVEVITIAVDYTNSFDIYETLRSELRKYEIGMLVNNVGMAVGFAEPFANIKDGKELHDIINCNIMSMVRMCHIVLPQMIERKKGVIVNIGSLSGVIAAPLATIYGATKGFVDKFSRDLSAEVRDKGVFVQTVHPGFVVTNMSKIKRKSISAPTPDQYAEATINTLGLEYRTAGYWYHKILFYWAEIARFFFSGIMEKRIMIFMDEYRRKVLLRASKTQ